MENLSTRPHMPKFTIVILDGNTYTATEGFPSINAARDAVTRLCLHMLLEGQSFENKRVAECRIEEVGTQREVSFKVSIEITDFI